MLDRINRINGQRRGGVVASQPHAHSWSQPIVKPLAARAAYRTCRKSRPPPHSSEGRTMHRVRRRPAPRPRGNNGSGSAPTSHQAAGGCRGCPLREAAHLWPRTSQTRTVDVNGLLRARQHSVCRGGARARARSITYGSKSTVRQEYRNDRTAVKAAQAQADGPAGRGSGLIPADMARPAAARAYGKRRVTAKPASHASQRRSSIRTASRSPRPRPFA